MPKSSRNYVAVCAESDFSSPKKPHDAGGFWDLNFADLHSAIVSVLELHDILLESTKIVE